MTLRTKTTLYVLAWSVLSIGCWSGLAQDPPPPPPPPSTQDPPKDAIKEDKTAGSKLDKGIGFIRGGAKRVAKGGKQVGKGAKEGAKEVTGKGGDKDSNKSAKPPEKPKE